MAKRKPWVDLSHEAQPLPGDELETWSRTHLIDMDRRFVERMERAIERGDERRDDPSRRPGREILNVRARNSSMILTDADFRLRPLPRRLASRLGLAPGW
jgi:hypothetical protein